MDGQIMPTQDGYVYKMTRKRRGQFIIINNTKFEPQAKMTERPGSDLDAARLSQAFSAVGFDCVIHKNKTCKQMCEIMKKGK